MLCDKSAGRERVKSFAACGLARPRKSLSGQEAETRTRPFRNAYNLRDE